MVASMGVRLGDGPLARYRIDPDALERFLRSADAAL
jgi:hypothetical protein